MQWMSLFVTHKKNTESFIKLAHIFKNETLS